MLINSFLYFNHNYNLNKKKHYIWRFETDYLNSNTNLNHNKSLNILIEESDSSCIHCQKEWHYIYRKNCVKLHLL